LIKFFIIMDGNCFFYENYKLSASAINSAISLTMI
jgi:hypothetical protein